MHFVVELLHPASTSKRIPHAEWEGDADDLYDAIDKALKAYPDFYFFGARGPFITEITEDD
jgi:hypothetical protein